MKIRLLRDKKGKALASINESIEDPNLVPLDVEAEDGGQEEEREVRPKDLMDMERFYEQVQRK